MADSAPLMQLFSAKARQVVVHALKISISPLQPFHYTFDVFSNSASVTTSINLEWFLPCLSLAEHENLVLLHV